VVLGHLIGPVSHDLGLHQVLNLLHRGGAVHLLTAEFHGLRDPLDLDRGHPGV
ncbi:Chorion class high-cysteine HCB protein 13, partial [Dysosmobacter welbionis]